ncbi:glycoside hydrolase, partial [bacterium]|nr:glycoside hydrolase [bacterium]
PRFDLLYHKENLSDDELIEFEVLFMLAWCGNYLRRENTLVRGLIEKAKGFTQADKADLLKNLSAFVQTILPFYATLQKEGVISISTTPFNHPILPLLIDINNAKLANMHTSLPDNPLSLKDDAIEQVKRSIVLYKKTFGTKPTGFWPAEGAVDEASVAIYKAEGLRWIASDEAILFRSIGDESRSNLYKPYRFNDMTIGFRDHGLSDLIGFTYRFKSGRDATDHFMSVLEPIAKVDNPTVFVTLDGENAWEFYENNAYDFFTALYQRLSRAPWCKTMTMDEASKLKNVGTLQTLSPGSWIHGDFNTWSGHPEKNRAWELIYQTRRDVDNFDGKISDEVAEKVRFHFLASESSDWFWWYGDDHVTEYAFEFDALFREHLITIYRLLGIQPPSDLFEPVITHKSSVSFLIKPQSSISPLIDGKNSYFFEWLGSGSVDESQLYSTMDRVRGPIEKIYYGFNKKSVFLAFEGKMVGLDTLGLELQVTIEETGEKLIFAMDGSFNSATSHLAADERVELSLSRSYFKALSSVHLRFEIVQEKTIIQTMPGFGSLPIDLDETYARNWFV